MSKLIAIGAVVLGIGLGAWSGYQFGSAGSPGPVAHTDMPTLFKREAGFSAERASSKHGWAPAVAAESVSNA